MKKIYKCDYCSKTGKKKKIKKHEKTCKHRPNNNLETDCECITSADECRPINERISYPVNQRIADGGWTYVATCSVCGNRISLWPYCEKKCSNCLSTIVH